jgi:hypothetical protein
VLLEHGQPLVHVLAVLRGDVASVAAQGRNAAVRARNLGNQTVAGIIRRVSNVNGLLVLQRESVIGGQHNQEPFENHAANELADLIAAQTLMQRATSDQKVAKICQTQHSLVSDVVPQKNAGAFNHIVIRLAFRKPRPSCDRVGNFQMEKLIESMKIVSRILLET